MDYLNRNLSFVLNHSQYLREKKETSVNADLLSFLLVLLVGSLFLVIAYIYQKGLIEQIQPLDLVSVTVLVASGIFLFVVDGFFVLLVISLIEHFFVVLVKRNKPKYDQTLKTVIYASFLPVILIWVPYVFHVSGSFAFLAVLFTIFTFTGSRAFHQLSSDHALFITCFTSAVIIILMYLGNVNLIG